MQIRDMELLRKVVLAIETADDDVNSYNLAIDGYCSDDIAFHCLLLMDAGLIEIAGEPFKTGGIKHKQIFISRLTMDGCDFADNIRKEDNWKLVKKVATAARAITLPALLATLQEMAETGLMEHSASILKLCHEAGLL